MSYEKIREELTSFYFGELPGEAERVRQTVFDKMDAYDSVHPNENSYRLKSKLYETIADTVKPRLFSDIPFCFETGALVAFSDGRFNRGAIHANGWLQIRNEHLYRDADPGRFDLYVKNKKASLYVQTGNYVDMMHIGIPMKKVFSAGLQGVMRELELAERDELLGTERDFIECAKAGIDALYTIQKKFAWEALECGMPELYDIAKRVPWEAPRTYHEGLCAMAFMRKALGAIEGVGFNSFGRADVLLKPLYDRDIAHGVSEERLLDLTCRFLTVWDCTLDRSEPLDSPYKYELENTLTLGGCDESGASVFNGVTRLFLAARKETNAVYPKMMLRYSKSSPEEYLALITESMLESKNFSLFENDDSIIPAMIESGIEPRDAINYVVGGCWDPQTPDCSNKFNGEYVNLLRPLEWAIHQPTESMEENELIFEPLDDADSFEELYERYLSYVHRVLMRKAVPMAEGSKLWHEVNPTCALSALLETCIQKRRDMTAGGGKYNRESVYFTGFAEVADSLLVIKKLCFEEKSCTLGELFDACRGDFPDEAFRRRAINVCSFGDGSEESSRLSGRLFDDLYRLTRDLPTSYGGQYRMGFNQYTEIIFWGEHTAATPNGRRKGDYLSQGISPSRLGKQAVATEVLGSYRYMDMKKSAGNASVTITLPGGKMSREQLVGFMRAVAISGIQALQPNCVSREELLAAQKDPDSYRHIIVRVCGFSAPFVLLSPTYQAEFLARNFAEV